MPVALERKLKREAKKKGLKGKRAGAYVYGTLRKRGMETKVKENPVQETLSGNGTYVSGTIPSRLVPPEDFGVPQRTILMIDALILIGLGWLCGCLVTTIAFVLMHRLSR